MPSKSVDLVMGSPPYLEARTYGIDAGLQCRAWVEWMLKITEEGMRVSRGPVLWVAAGTGNYAPAVEGLIWKGWERGWRLQRPAIWTKNAAPTGSKWFSNDWEFVVAFGEVCYWNPQAIETPLKYSKGGAFRQRKKNGERSAGGEYPKHKMRKRPSNVFHVTVGGGHLGSDLAHENEAPYPERLVEPFVKALTPSGGTVLDPFCGSGTTLAVAKRLGRNSIGIDLRQSQIELSGRRLAETKGK